MLRSVTHLIAFLCYAGLALLVITFAVANREATIFSLYPLPYEMEMPKFLFGLIMLVAGALSASLIAWLKGMRVKKQLALAQKRAQALENELAGYKSRAVDIPAALPPAGNVA